MSSLSRTARQSPSIRIVRAEAGRVSGTAGERRDNERDALLAGLHDPSASISPKYFYDDVGCRLFSRICMQPEYYPTRTEAGIFAQFGAEIGSFLPVDAQWIDLGCGDCAKSRVWLGQVRPARFVGVDIADAWLTAAIAAMAADYPDIECLGVAMDFTRGVALRNVLDEHPGAPVFFYPGSSIGNFSPDRALAFLGEIRANCGKNGKLLIGVDLVKDVDVLEAAYNDAAGVTAAFNLNVLKVVNRLLDADFDTDRFSHHAFFNRAKSRIEMHLRSTTRQRVCLGNIPRVFEEGEHILTEYSCKYRPGDVTTLLQEAGFSRCRAWTDARGWFGVFLAEVD